MYGLKPNLENRQDAPRRDVDATRQVAAIGPGSCIGVANLSGMGGRLQEFISISRLLPDVAREMIISRNAPSFSVI